MTNRFVLAGIALVVGLVLGWAVHGLLGYSQTTDTATTYEDWRVLCPAASANGQHCTIEQDTVNSKTGQSVARVAILTDKNKLSLITTVPLGVALQPGVSFAFGSDAPKTLPYRLCTAQGCVAEIAMDDKLQAGFDAGKDGHLVFTLPQANAKPVTVPVSLKGFATAERAYRNAEAKRSSWFWRMF